MKVPPGRITCLVGRNGMGKTTTLMTIMGVVSPTGGRITFDGEALQGRTSHEIASRGLTLVPEGRWLFGSLTVEENLRFAALVSKSGDVTAIGQVLELFPDLQNRRRQLARTLSGGLQQMLAIARALITRPRVMLLDEPSQGLAPLYVQRVAQYIRQARDDGLSLLLVEQNWTMAASLADYIYVIAHGKVEFECDAREIEENRDTVTRLLSVGV
jgi:branched-chain amino acid transport system ATP-binding protein